MKRYLLFTYAYYEANGGWGDFRGDADTIFQARVLAEEEFYEVAHIVDSEIGKIVLYKPHRIITSYKLKGGIVKYYWQHIDEWGEDEEWTTEHVNANMGVTKAGEK